MRNILAFLLAMTLVLSGKMLLNPVEIMAIPSDVAITKTEGLTSFISNQSNAVEKDGVRFEILVPESTWVIPDNKSDASTPVRLGIRITNKTQKPIRFPQFDPVMGAIIDIVGEDGLALTRQAGRNMLLKSGKLACLLIQPEKSLTFFVDANLYWQNNKLQLGGSAGLGGWNFNNLKAGNYQVRFKYISSSSVELCDDPETAAPRLVEGLWTGFVLTPFVEIRIVER